MSAPSEHDHAAPGLRPLATALLINVAVTAVEGVAGVLAGSLALLADALHNLTDVASLMLAWAGARLAARAPTPSRTFGLAGLQRLGTATVGGPTVMLLGALALAGGRHS